MTDFVGLIELVARPARLRQAQPRPSAVALALRLRRRAEQGTADIDVRRLRPRGPDLVHEHQHVRSHRVGQPNLGGLGQHRRRPPARDPDRPRRRADFSLDVSVAARALRQTSSDIGRATVHGGTTATAVAPAERPARTQAVASSRLDGTGSTPIDRRPRTWRSTGVLGLIEDGGSQIAQSLATAAKVPAEPPAALLRPQHLAAGTQRPSDLAFRAMEERTPHEVLELVAAEGVEFVDLRFCDLPGVMQHVSIPANVLDEGQFEDGHAFDGSSVRGFQQIQESDMVLIADPNTAYLDPFRTRKTLNMHCYVADPVTGERYSRDPRYVAQKAQEHLFSTGMADTAYFGPEPEFFIFDDVRFEHDAQRQLLPGRLGRGAVEHRHRRGPEPRVQAADQGGVLPRPADGPLPGPALRHGGHAAPGGHRHRAAPPRGGVGRSGRDRHPLRHAAGDGRQPDDVQVRPQERGLGGGQERSRSCRSRSSRTTARACTRTSRCGRAASRSSTTRPATRACPTWPAGTSAACCTTRTR